MMGSETFINWDVAWQWVLSLDALHWAMIISLLVIVVIAASALIVLEKILGAYGRW